MPNAKVVVTDYIETDMDWEVAEFAKHPVTFEYYQLKFAPQDELVAKIRDADILIVNMAPMTAEVIEKLERCKLIIRHGIGYDNVDVDACTRMGIRLANVPDYCAEEVAEQAIALIFACARRMFLGRSILEESSANGQWDFSRLGPVYRFTGKTLAIVGCGRIGSRVYRKLQGFDLTRLVCDPYIDERRMGALGIEETHDLEHVLRESDFVTLHTPLNDETHHMIDEPQLRLMKPTAYLINTSRGAVINTDALIRACREGWIAGAGIDVYEHEPPHPESELFRLDNVTLSPHLGWCSEEAGLAIRRKILEDVIRCLNDQPPRFTVNEDVEQVLAGKAYREV
ncbi:MAG: C-terminal binding protein [Armatimonadota bacterium]